MGHQENEGRDRQRREGGGVPAGDGTTGRIVGDGEVDTFHGSGGRRERGGEPEPGPSEYQKCEDSGTAQGDCAIHENSSYWGERDVSEDLARPPGGYGE